MPPGRRLLTVSLLLAALPARAGWFDGQGEGWHFYREPPPAEEKTLREAPPPLQPAEPPRPEPHFAERMRQKGDELLSTAIEDPTEENVRQFMVHNKEMLDRSNRLARVWQRVLMESPELFLSVAEEDIFERTSRSIESLRERAGLYFFYSAACPHCRRQAEALRQFQRKYDFAVLPITVDGGILPEFPETRQDNGIAARLGVSKVPALYLVFPKEDRIQLFAQGYAGSMDIERRFFYYAQADKESDPGPAPDHPAPR